MRFASGSSGATSTDEGAERMTFNAELIVPTRWFKWASCQRVAMLWKGAALAPGQTQVGVHIVLRLHGSFFPMI